MQEPIVKVEVGPFPATYHIPFALLSHFAPSLVSAETTPVDPRRVRPETFSLLHQYMYCGSYYLGLGIALVINTWMLSKRPKSTPLKNYVMGRLWYTYCSSSTISHLGLQPRDLDRIFRCTRPGARLREFVLDMIVMNFENLDCVTGSSEEWHEMLTKYPETGLMLLKGLRRKGSVTPDREIYMEDEGSK
ncbi:hypothetical protein P154DRAFT_517315 [Amniculicola lignicola CBS 123094]|uniref:BTB domain-containing protein n=1 Tax=Amniculicola lignicola CBS 123094 TaxID=1392246 RepID=A0A6A5WYR8_9PLEO|nr:hypothetical protein P154DRAFT_517315 [Amniculicola lignicola CBS 123094]